MEALRHFGLARSRRTDGFTLYGEGGVRADSSEVKAARQDNGWWVPLRAVADRFGWTISWEPGSREVIVDLPRASQ